jgi:hypothetical protein
VIRVNISGGKLLLLQRPDPSAEKFCRDRESAEKEEEMQGRIIEHLSGL